jgi:AraC family transcriptional regulator
MEERILSISRALDFIEAHLREEVRVEDMAASCGYSLFYFIRLFDQTVHHTPYDYLIRRRLTEAAQEILYNRRRLLDIALDYRFQNAETFTRAFYRVFRIKPSELRKDGRMDGRLMLPARSTAQLLYFQKHGIPEALRLTCSQRYLAGYPFEEDISVDHLGAVYARLQAHSPHCNAWFWVSTYSVDARDRRPTYFAGFEIADLSMLPVDLYVRCLPAGDWVGFRQPALLENLIFVRDFVYQSWQANNAECLSSPLEVGCFSGGSDGSQFSLAIPIFKTGASGF